MTEKNCLFWIHDLLKMTTSIHMGTIRNICKNWTWRTAIVTLPPLHDIAREEKCIFKAAGVLLLMPLVLQISWKFISAFKDECFDVESFKLISSLLFSALLIPSAEQHFPPCCTVSMGLWNPLWGLCCKPPSKHPQSTSIPENVVSQLQGLAFRLCILDELGDDHRLACAPGTSSH